MLSTVSLTQEETRNSIGEFLKFLLSLWMRNLLKIEERKKRVRGIKPLIIIFDTWIYFRFGNGFVLVKSFVFGREGVVGLWASFSWRSLGTNKWILLHSRSLNMLELKKNMKITFAATWITCRCGFVFVSIMSNFPFSEGGKGRFAASIIIKNWIWCRNVGVISLKFLNINKQ